LANWQGFTRLMLPWKVSCRSGQASVVSISSFYACKTIRLGFSFEGIFRQHFIIKNRNRDTAWFAMMDRDWPDIKANIKQWLYAADGSISLSALNKKLLQPTCREI